MIGFYEVFKKKKALSNASALPAILYVHYHPLMGKQGLPCVCTSSRRAIATPTEFVCSFQERKEKKTYTGSSINCSFLHQCKTSLVIEFKMIALVLYLITVRTVKESPVTYPNVEIMLCLLPLKYKMSFKICQPVYHPTRLRCLPVSR